MNTRSQSGARFFKCALQVNPEHYRSTYRGQSATGDPLSYAREVIDQAVALKIEVLAVTDHNSVSDVGTFRAAAKGRPVHVLPGFELSSSEGVHVLCVYPQDASVDQLGRYLGELGVRDTGPSSDPSDKPFGEVLSCVQSQGGMAIAAHATNDGGLFRALSGKARVRAWRDPNLLAVQIPGPVEDLPPKYRPIFENRNPDYRRADAPETGVAVAAINAADVTDPAQLADSSATCWIKMNEVGIEGLKQAFLDPGSRIRLNPLDLDEHMELLEMSWKGGFLGGVSVQFNPNLNVLIGGRGTGKSTVIESIRSVLGLEPVGDDARKAHDAIIRQVLGSGTKISLDVRVHRPGRRDYRIERTIPNPPFVREASGEVSHLAPEDVLPKIEAYGQHEISELSKNEEKLTRLLDRFVERDESMASRKTSLRRQLQKNRQALCDNRAQMEALEERLGTLPGLEENLQRFREVGLEEKLSEQSLLLREERVLDSVPDRLAPFGEALATLKRELPIDRAFLSERALRDLPAKEVLSEANQVLADLESALESIKCEFGAALERAQAGTAKVRNLSTTLTQGLVGFTESSPVFRRRAC